MSRTLWKFAAAVVFACAALSNAYGVNGGVLGGISMGWIGGDDWHDMLDSLGLENKAQPSMLYGAYLEFSYSSGVSFRPEIQVMTVRGSGSGTFMGSGSSMNSRAKVLHIPLLVCGRYPYGPGSFYGILGPSMNLFLTEIDSTSSVLGSTTEVSEKPYYGVVWGIVAGIGYELPILSSRVVADLRYQRSLTAITQEGENNFQSVILLLGVSFTIPND